MFNWTINVFNLSRSTYIERPVNTKASSSDDDDKPQGPWCHETSTFLKYVLDRNDIYDIFALTCTVHLHITIFNILRFDHKFDIPEGRGSSLLARTRWLSPWGHPGSKLKFLVTPALRFHYWIGTSIDLLSFSFFLLSMSPKWLPHLTCTFSYTSSALLCMLLQFQVNLNLVA